MLTEVVRVDSARPNEADISRAAACLRRGGLVAFPTETVYGLGVHALDRPAVQRLFEAKGRPANDPVIIHVASLDQVAPLVAGLPSHTARLAARFWPGPLTLIMRKASAIPLEVTAGLDTVAVRVPAHPVARALLLAAGLPVAAPSANLFSRPSPTLAAHVLDDLDGRIDMVVDGGPTQLGLESTVLDLTVEPPVVLRPGAVSIERLREVVPAISLPAGSLRGTRPTYIGDGTPMSSPGQLAKHYAPLAPMTMYSGDPAATLDAILSAARAAIAQGQRVGVLATTQDVALLCSMPLFVAELGSAEDAEEVASRLYTALRKLDAAGVDLILTRDIFRDDGLWRAVRDRLHRAATHMLDC